MRAEILAFVASLRQPALVGEGGVFRRLPNGPASDPADSGWGLEVEFGKLLIQFWGEGRSTVRRIEGIERDGNMLRIRARKPGGAPVRLEIGEAEVLALGIGTGESEG